MDLLRLLVERAPWEAGDADLLRLLVQRAPWEAGDADLLRLSVVVAGSLFGT